MVCVYRTEQKQYRKQKRIPISWNCEVSSHISVPFPNTEEEVNFVYKKKQGQIRQIRGHLIYFMLCGMAMKIAFVMHECLDYWLDASCPLPCTTFPHCLFITSTLSLFPTICHHMPHSLSIPIFIWNIMEILLIEMIMSLTITFTYTHPFTKLKLKQKLKLIEILSHIRIQGRWDVTNIQY